MNLIKIDLHVHSQDSSHTGSNISQESDLEKLLILTKKESKLLVFLTMIIFILKVIWNVLK